MGCAVTAKRSPRALLRLQRETQNSRAAGTPQAPTAGTHRRHPPQAAAAPPPGRRGGQEQIQQGGGGRLGAGHTAWEELCPPTVSPSCPWPHTLRLGPGLYRSWASTQLSPCQGTSMKGRACEGQGKAASSPGCLAGQPCHVTASRLHVLSHPELATAPCISYICLLPCVPGLKHIPGQAQILSYPNLCCQQTQLTLTPSRRCNFWDVGLCMKHNAINSSAS